MAVVAFAVTVDQSFKRPLDLKAPSVSNKGVRQVKEHGSGPPLQSPLKAARAPISPPASGDLAHKPPVEVPDEAMTLASLPLGKI
jgi:hypothetical protein